MHEQVYLSENIAVCDLVDAEGEKQRQLLLGPPFVHPQGTIKLQRPGYHVYQFSQNLTYAGLCVQGGVSKALFLGLGVGMTVQALRKLFPEMHATVVDLNRELFQVANDFFFPLASDLVHLVHGDAHRHILDTTEQYDYIACDLWSGALEVPAFLVQPESYQRFKAILKPGGVFAINAPSHLHKSVAHMVATAFEHGQSVLANNTLIIASDQPLVPACDEDLKRSLLAENLDVDKIGSQSLFFNRKR